MYFDIDELLVNSDGCVFYKRSDEILGKQYRVVTSVSDVGPDAIYVPQKVSINGVLRDNYKDGTLYHALENGAGGIFFSEREYLDPEYKRILLDIINKYKDRLDIVIVPKGSNVEMLMKMAFYVRTARISEKTKVVAITGSIGKTSTTEMMYSILSQSHSVYKSSVANIRVVIMSKMVEIDRPDYDYILVECSGANKGYLKQYSDSIYPNGIIITRAALENIESFGSLDNISAEKSTLMDSMSENDIAVINDTPSFRKYANNYRPKKVFVPDDGYELIETGKDGSRFKYKNVEYSIPVVGVHQISNAIKAIELALQLGISIEDIQNGLKSFQQAIDRWVSDKYDGDVEFITDCPNNPSYNTLVANVKTFIELYKDEPRKRRLCIGRIKSLGDLEHDYYLKIAKWLITLPLDEIIVVDTEAVFIHDYIKANSNIKTVFFERPASISSEEPLFKYLIETMDYPQVILFKLNRDDYGIKFGKSKELIRDVLKDRYLGVGN